MRSVTVTLQGKAPYSASRAHQEPKLNKETADAHEDRTWKHKAHVQDGKVFIPPMAFKIGLDRAAKMLGRQIPGKGKATYTKFFESGIIVTDPVFIADESAIEMDRIHANSDGVRGSGKRVWRNFPKISDWSGKVTFFLLADEITPEVFEETMKYAGIAVGVGRFRPERGGFYGRFEATKFEWADMV